MTPEQRERLRALAEAATPGRWHIYGGHNDYAIYSAVGDDVEHVMNLDAYEMKPSLTNAEWIAAAHPQAVLELLDALAERDAEVARLTAALEVERDRLRGIQPEFPPRPPHGEGLPRYGIRHNGPTEPLAVPMADGYWTPWHLAEQAEATTRRLRAWMAEYPDDKYTGTWWLAEFDRIIALAGTPEGPS